MPSRLRLRPPAARLWAWLPRGRELAPADFAWRHRVVCLLLALHVPGLLLAAVATGRPLPDAALSAAPVLALLAVAVLPLPRRLRSCAATLGLVSCSALLVSLSAQVPELHFHYFVVVAVVALYQDWLTFALAIVFAALQHGLMGALADGHTVNSTYGPWTWALVHAGSLLAEATVLVLFWHANEQARAAQDQAQTERQQAQAAQAQAQAERAQAQAEQERARREQEQVRSLLVEGQSSVQARLAETDRIRTDLIGTVSHEFRTPLTSIRGTALTLLKRGERLDDQGRAQLLHAVLEQQERLSRLLENMLTAARATAADPAAVAEVDGVAAEVAMLSGARRADYPAPSVVVEPGTVARIDRQALHQVLANLVDNAQQHGTPGAVPVLAGGQDRDGVWISVSNEGRALQEWSTDRLFEPFTQGDSGPTRGSEGLGMGLYVVRRLIEVYDGTVSASSEGGWVTVEVRLRQARPHVPEARQHALAG